MELPPHTLIQGAQVHTDPDCVMCFRDNHHPCTPFRRFLHTSYDALLEHTSEFCFDLSQER